MTCFRSGSCRKTHQGSRSGQPALGRRGVRRPLRRGARARLGVPAGGRAAGRRHARPRADSAAAGRHARAAVRRCGLRRHARRAGRGARRGRPALHDPGQDEPAPGRHERRARVPRDARSPTAVRSPWSACSRWSSPTTAAASPPPSATRCRRRSRSGWRSLRPGASCRRRGSIRRAQRSSRTR